MTAIELTAIKRTARTILMLTLVSLAIPAIIFFVPLDIVITAGLFFMLTFVVKMIYDSKLEEAQREAENTKV
jgi:hypothetical protein